MVLLDVESRRVPLPLLLPTEAKAMKDFHSIPNKQPLLSPVFGGIWIWL
jgi:hypothetical protein